MKLGANGTQLGVDFDLAVELFFLGKARLQLGRCRLPGGQERKSIQLVAQGLAGARRHRQVLAQKLFVQALQIQRHG